MIEIILIVVAVLFALYAYYLQTQVQNLTERINHLDRDLTEETVPAHMLGIEPHKVPNLASLTETLRSAGATEPKALEAAKLAIGHSWTLLDIQANIKMVRFMRAGDGGVTKINIYYGGKGGRSNLFTVATALNHPIKGKTQLFRKHITTQELEAILKNPRMHTDKGYYGNGR